MADIFGPINSYEPGGGYFGPGSNHRPLVDRRNRALTIERDGLRGDLYLNQIAGSLRFYLGRGYRIATNPFTTHELAAAGVESDLIEIAVNSAAERAKID